MRPVWKFTDEESLMTNEMFVEINTCVEMTENLIYKLKRSIL